MDVICRLPDETVAGARAARGKSRPPQISNGTYTVQVVLRVHALETGARSENTNTEPACLNPSEEEISVVPTLPAYSNIIL